MKKDQLWRNAETSKPAPGNPDKARATHAPLSPSRRPAATATAGVSRHRRCSPAFTVPTPLLASPALQSLHSPSLSPGQVEISVRSPPFFSFPYHFLSCAQQPHLSIQNCRSRCPLTQTAPVFHSARILRRFRPYRDNGSTMQWIDNGCKHRHI